MTRRAWRLAALAGLLAVILLVVAVEALHWPVQWGTAGEWVSGGGTIAAIVFAGLALRHDIDARREELEHRAWADARKVELELARPSLRGLGVAAGKAAVILTNGSLGELRDASLTVFNGDEATPFDLGNLPPGAHRHELVAATWAGGELRGMRALMHWTDLGGRHWHLDSSGQLTRVKH